MEEIRSPQTQSNHQQPERFFLHYRPAAHLAELFLKIGHASGKGTALGWIKPQREPPRHQDRDDIGRQKSQQPAAPEHFHMPDVLNDSPARDRGRSRDDGLVKYTG